MVNDPKIEIISYSEIDQEPVLLDFPTSYCLRKGTKGKVQIAMLVDTNGTVIQSKLEKSSRVKELDYAALICGLNHKFTPAIHKNRKVRVWLRTEFSFGY